MVKICRKCKIYKIIFQYAEYATNQNAIHVVYANMQNNMYKISIPICRICVKPKHCKTCYICKICNEYANKYAEYINKYAKKVCRKCKICNHFPICRN